MQTRFEQISNVACTVGAGFLLVREGRHRSARGGQNEPVVLEGSQGPQCGLVLT